MSARTSINQTPNIQRTRNNRGHAPFFLLFAIQAVLLLHSHVSLCHNSLRSARGSGNLVDYLFDMHLMHRSAVLVLGYQQVFLFSFFIDWSAPCVEIASIKLFYRQSDTHVRSQSRVEPGRVWQMEISIKP